MKFRTESRREVNAGSMADIAFLLLIFFLVTTQIQSEKGLKMKLPPNEPNTIEQRINDQNIFKILINSQDRLLVEGELWDNMEELSPSIIEFINNRGSNDQLSDSPEKAIVSIKTDRGTSYRQFIKVLDRVQGAYYQLRAESLKITTEEYRNLDLSDPADFQIYLAGRELYPMKISIAEPSDTTPE